MDKKLIIITGANSGVGLQVAKSFSRAGYPLLLIDLNIDTLEDLQLNNSINKKVNITDIEAFKKAISEAEELFGPVDCLINNAGVIRMGHTADQSSDTYKFLFEVNVIGTLNGINAVVPGMKERSCGTIINMGSLGGFKLIPDQTVYCGTKHAIHGLSEGIRQELAGSNIRVTTIAPGAIETPLLNGNDNPDFKKGQDEWAKSIGGILTPEDLAKTMLFIYEQPQSVCIREIVLAPTKQQF